MKKNLLYFFAGLTVLIGVNSCKENIYQAEVAALDSLVVVLENAEKSMMAIDSVETDKAYTEIISNLKLIQSELKDTVTREDAFLLSDYREIRKTLGRFNEVKNKLKSEVPFTREQLSNLSKDLKKGLVPEDKVKEYYMVEFTEAVKLQQEIESMVASVTNSLNKYNRLKPEVDHFIARMQENNLKKMSEKE